MADPNPSDADRLKALEDRLARVTGKAPEKAHQEEHYSQGQVAWRMVIELVAGLSIGFGIGYGLDRLFGTMPIFLVLFVLLGLAAGVNVMLRTAKEIGNGGQTPASKGDDHG
ncbi:AtpZ/AtpI family protein [Pseudoroseicyclus sp. H15]